MSPLCTVTSGSIDKLSGCIKDHLARQFSIPTADQRAHDWVILSTPEPNNFATHGRRRVLVEIEVSA
jgi:hypothetical protein